MKYYEYGCEITIVVDENDLYDPNSDPDQYMAETIQGVIGHTGASVADEPTLLREYEA